RRPRSASPCSVSQPSRWIRTGPDDVSSRASAPPSSLRIPLTLLVSMKSRIEKLGVRQGTRVSILGVPDADLRAELAAAGADVSLRVRAHSDIVFVAVGTIAALARLATLEPYLERNGAVWAVFPKGRKELRDVDVIRAGVAAGLVDNKVIRFSETHTAFRFVIPLARR